MYPYILLGGGYYIPTYLLVISLTYSALLIWLYYRADKLGLPTGAALDYCLMVMVGGFFGARMMHVFYENWEYYKLFPLDILKVWEGGFVYYGGTMGALLAAGIYSRLTRNSLWKWTDFFAPALAIGYAIGRVGCFLNGCCFGVVCELPWAVEFTQPGLPTGHRHPTQLYAMFWELCVTLPLILLMPKKKAHLFKREGQIFGIWLMSHGVGRLLMELFRDDFRGPELLGVSVSTCLSLVAIVFGALFFFRRLGGRATK